VRVLLEVVQLRMDATTIRGSRTSALATPPRWPSVAGAARSRPVSWVTLPTSSAVTAHVIGVSTRSSAHLRLRSRRSVEGSVTTLARRSSSAGQLAVVDDRGRLPVAGPVTSALAAGTYY
jgi:hypothetical protein